MSDVVVVAHDVAGAGGMERQLRHLISGLLDAGHRITLLSRSSDLAPRHGLRWVRVQGPARPVALAYPWFALWASLWLHRNRRGELVHATGAVVLPRVDVITVHLCHAALAGVGVQRSRRPTLAYRVNAAVSDRLARAGERWSYRQGRVRALVGVSAGVARELNEHFPAMRRQVRVIGNGVDLGDFHPDGAARLTVRSSLGIGSDDFVAIFVGGEWAGKGLAIAIEAVAAVAGCHLVVVGEGDSGRFQHLAGEHEVAGRIHFVGPVSDVAPLYAGADVFVLPSAYESFSLVTFEAAAAGLPLLDPRLSGVEELLIDGENGWFVERRAGDISARLSQLRDDRALRKRLGAAARRRAAGFDWATMVSGYATLYRDLDAAGDGSPAPA